MKRFLWNLQGKKALITGGTRGIGRAIVDEFLQFGAEVFVVSKNKNNLNEAIKNWCAAGHSVYGIAADLNQDEVYSMVINEVT